MAPASTSSAGPSARALTAPMTRPMAAGTAALPTAEAATWRPTVCVAPPAPTRSAVVRVSSGNTGAAASPSTIIPATATAPGPGSAISSAPNGTVATATASTRDAPARSASGPSTARPANIIAQYADTATPATVTGRPRPDVRNTYPQMPAADSTPVSTAVNVSPARIPIRPGDGRLRSEGTSSAGTAGTVHRCRAAARSTAVAARTIDIDPIVKRHPDPLASSAVTSSGPSVAPSP